MLNHFKTSSYSQISSNITRYPHISFGISIQTPPQFTTPYTKISTKSFLNPYLNYQSERVQQIPSNLSIKQKVHPQWRNKIDINQVQTDRKFLDRTYIGKSKQQDLYNIGQLQPNQRYNKEFLTSKSRFRLTKGQFTNFLQRNHSKSLFGPLIGTERDSKKYLLTKHMIAQNSSAKLSKNMQKLSRYNNKFDRSYSPLDQKYQLKKTRLSFGKGYGNSLHERKTLTQRNMKFMLPHLSTIANGNLSGKYNRSRQNLLLTIKNPTPTTSRHSFYNNSEQRPHKGSFLGNKLQTNTSSKTKMFSKNLESIQHLNDVGLLGDRNYDNREQERINLMDVKEFYDANTRTLLSQKSIERLDELKTFVNTKRGFYLLTNKNKQYKLQSKQQKQQSNQQKLQNKLQGNQFNNQKLTQ